GSAMPLLSYWGAAWNDATHPRPPFPGVGEVGSGSDQSDAEVTEKFQTAGGKSCPAEPWRARGHLTGRLGFRFSLPFRPLEQVVITIPVGQHPAGHAMDGREPVAAAGGRAGRVGGVALEEDVPGRPVPAGGPAARGEAGADGGRSHAAG